MGNREPRLGEGEQSRIRTGLVSIGTDMRKWIGSNYNFPMAWRMKQAVPAELKSEAKIVDFGLHGAAWIAVDPDGRALMKTGRRMQLVEFHLRTPGWVIGPRDAEAARGVKWEDEWRTAMHDKIADEIRLRHDL